MRTERCIQYTTHRAPGCGGPARRRKTRGSAESAASGAGTSFVSEWLIFGNSPRPARGFAFIIGKRKASSNDSLDNDFSKFTKARPGFGATETPVRAFAVAKLLDRSPL